MVGFMGLLLGDKKLPSRQIFRSIISEHVRIQVLRALLEQASINKYKGREYDDVIDKFASLNTKRNAYVHGQWASHESGKVFLSESSTDDFHFLEQREVKLKELKSVLNEMGELWRKILYLVEPNSSREKPPQPPDGASK